MKTHPLKPEVTQTITTCGGCALTEILGSLTYKKRVSFKMYTLFEIGFNYKYASHAQFEY